MKHTQVSIALLLSIFLSTFAVAQMHMMGHSKMHMKSDTSIVKDTSKVTGHDKYSCPMHPEIIRDKPGSCPICEMDLVPKKPE